MRWLGLIVALTLFGVTTASAQVVALGDSATRGYLLPITDAWPAKLEGLLRQRGINVGVANQGVNGDTSDGMLSRLDSAVPDGTRV
jgi:acyl-CoA thioesterase-1